MFLITKKNPLLVTFAIFAIFADILGPFLASFLSKSRILLNLLFLRFLRYLSWVFLASKKNPCYICHGCFQLARKILVTFAIFAIFADISGPFLASFLCKSGILLHLVFLRYLRYLSWVFLANMKNPCYFCDFCDICGHFGVLLAFFFLSLDSCYIRYFCDICHGCFWLARKILVTFAIFAIFADISRSFLASFFSKSGILLHLLFFAIFAILVMGVFS